MPVTGRTICSDALIEIGALAAGETATPEDLDLALGKVNRLFDNWNAERCAVFADVFTTFTITPSLSPHTIGPTGTFVVTQRPMEIPDGGAGLVLVASNPDVRIPITVRDAQWWAGQSVKALTSAIPTDLYYEPTWPNGNLFLWPVPTVANGLELQLRTLLAAITLDTTFSLPPGYRDAITLTLAESLVSPLGAASKVAPTLPADATKARARIFGANDVTPRIATQDAGMPTNRGPRATFNYLIGR